MLAAPFPEVMALAEQVASCHRVVTCLRQWKKKLVETGFQTLVFEDAMEVVIDQLNSLGTTEPLVVSQLEANMRDAMLSPMIVMLLRMLASAEIQRRGDFFGPFIMVRLHLLFLCFLWSASSSSSTFPVMPGVLRPGRRRLQSCAHSKIIMCSNGLT